MVLPPTEKGKTEGRVVLEEQVLCFRQMRLQMPGSSSGMDVLLAFAHAKLGIINMVQMRNRNLHA